MFLESVVKKLNISQTSIEIIKNNLRKILRNKINDSVGLVYGKVQSGKTRNLICLTAELFDRDIELIIILFADTKILLQQNLERFEEAFQETTENNRLLLKDSDQILSLSNKEVLNYHHSKKTKILICGLKHSKHISNIMEVIKNTPYMNSKSVIIDDEGDDTTQNTAKEKFNGHGIEINRSSVNGKLIDLKESLNCGLISITATPQANLLLQPTQELAPSWCEVLEISPEYTGLDSFFEDSYLIQLINDDPNRFKSKSATPSSFIDSLAYFITSATILNKKNDLSKFQMLVHPDSRVVTHQNISRKIKDNLSFYFENLNYKAEVMEKIKSSFEDIKFRNMSEDGQDIGEFSDYAYEDFLSTMKMIHVVELNTKGPLNTKDIKRLIKENLPYLIFVGGNLLDRGVTFPDLLVTYIFRESKNMQWDTLLQRARWLGYRKSILNFSKVYLTPNLYQAYKEIVESDNHLVQMIEYFSNRKDKDLRLEDFRMRLKDLYNPTNKSKAIWETNNTSWYIQSIPDTANNNNSNLIKEFWGNEENSVDIFMNQKKTISLKNFNKLIENYKFSVKDTKIINFKKFLKELNLDEDVEFEFLLMRKGNPEERSLNKEKNEINNLFQGQSSKSTSIYPGDRYLLGDKIMLQVHFVKLKEDLIENGKVVGEKGTVYPMIAVGIPYNLREEIFIQRKTLFNLI